MFVFFPGSCFSVRAETPDVICFVSSLGQEAKQLVEQFLQSTRSTPCPVQKLLAISLFSTKVEKS